MIRAMPAIKRPGTRRWAATLLLAAAAAAPTAPAQPALQRQIAEALDRARPAMLSMSKNTSGGVHALLCLAMSHDGLTMHDREFATAIERLERAKLSQTYELSCRLMVMAKLREYPGRRKAARRDLKALLRNQKGGGFTYRSKGGRWDLSNTQYAALGIRLRSRPAV